MNRQRIKTRAREITQNNLQAACFAHLVPRVLSPLALVLSTPVAAGFSLGENKVYLDLARTGKAELEELFGGFRSFHRYASALLTYVIKGLYVTVGTMLLLVPGIYFALKYVFAGMVLADEPGISALDAIRRSEQLTKDRLGEVLGFTLSFLPWFLLGLIPIVGWLVVSIFVLPYYKTALAAYYYTCKDAAVREAERKAGFKYPGGTPTKKNETTRTDFARQQALAQQQAFAQQQAYARQQAYNRQEPPSE